MKSKFSFLLFLLFLTFLFEYVGWFLPIRKLGNKWLISVYRAHIKVIDRVRMPYDFVIFSFNKYKYTKKLESRYTKTLSKLSELDSLKEENKALRKMIENNDVKTKKTIITAPVVSLSYPAVGVGSANGVKTNNMVLFNGMLIGTIGEVGDYQSKVLLLSKFRKNKVLAKTESGVEGIIKGDGKNILFTQVPRNIKLVDGERVVAVGQEGIEKNTFIGILKSIKNNPSAPTQTAIISQPVSFYDVVLLEVR